MKHYDLAIIGSGSGNSIPEYFSNSSVALIEKGTFGGTCLNVGCIPSKMFVLPGETANIVRDANKLNVNATLESVDFSAVRDRVFGRIDPISDSGKEYRASLDNVDLITGEAKFIASKTLEVNGEQITAEAILIASGARSVIPDLPGISDIKVHTSDTVMRLPELPKRMAIIGGGFIAAEMGHVFASYGTKVNLFNRGKKLLKSQDSDISAAFTKQFSKSVNLCLGELPKSFANRGNEIVIETNDGELLVDVVLVATGRVPNNDLLNLAAAGVELNERGVIKVDQHMQTSADGVWAIGDAANSFQLKHVANAEAKVAFWNIANPTEPKTINYEAIPHAVFTDPQIASVGATEDTATELGLDFSIGRTDYAGTAYGWALGDESSFAKVLVDRGSGLILGAHIIGPQAATLIQPLVQAMALNTPAETVAKGVYYIHPALTEVVENAVLHALSE